MKILVINSGSSSIRYKLYEYPKNKLLDKGHIENIGEEDSSVKNHNQGIKFLMDKIVSAGVISNLNQISAIGHRVVHGGEYFTVPKIVDQDVIDKIKLCVNLAPLHNPANLAGIEGCKKLLPNVLQIVVFDTAFHQTIQKM
ncbi:MAG: acetate kinase, partial [Candidatus Omnitrophica bacterium]|nr:acetate kinase [Candidatus Omnitrophota bacterium]